MKSIMGSKEIKTVGELQESLKAQSKMFLLLYKKGTEKSDGAWFIWIDDFASRIDLCK